MKSEQEGYGRRMRLGLIACSLALGAPTWAQNTTRVSEPTGGGQAFGDSEKPSMSDCGRYVAFHCSTDDMHPDDMNGHYDVYVKDRSTGAVELISRSDLFAQTDGSSVDPAISGDGRFVAYTSYASNITAWDLNGSADVYVYDRLHGSTERISNTPGTVFSADGSSHEASISDDGRHVAFTSYASTLVPGDANTEADVFVVDRHNGTVVRASDGLLGADGDLGSFEPDISSDGRFVAYTSHASNLVAMDNNNTQDVFLYDAETGQVELVSTFGGFFPLSDVSYAPSVSDDGSKVAFCTGAPLGGLDINGAVDVVVRDRDANNLIVISLAPGPQTANGPSTRPCITDDGRYVVYDSLADDLVAGDTNGSWDVFRSRVSNWATGTARVSVKQDGSECSDTSTNAVISADSTQIAFQSFANDLVPGDLGFQDSFVRNLGPAFPELYCQGKLASSGCVPFLSFSGTPRTSGTAPFRVTAHGFDTTEAGFMIYGTSGRSNLNYHGGKLCVKVPFHRWLPIKPSKQPSLGGCTGAMGRNFNQRIQNGVDPLLTAGQVVQAQWIQRDSGDAFGDALSNGIEFTIGN